MGSRGAGRRHIVRLPWTSPGGEPAGLRDDAPSTGLGDRRRQAVQRACPFTPGGSARHRRLAADPPGVNPPGYARRPVNGAWVVGGDEPGSAGVVGTVQARPG
ncbi:MAG: hypothetical protein R2838_09390 [Caldilineaceae bacterium]